MRLMKKLMAAASDAFQIVHIVREGSATNREVQCEGDRDETETGREIFGEVWNLGNPGVKHRAAAKVGGVAKEKGLILRLGNFSILLGAYLEDGEPSDLDEGDTAIYSAGGGQVRCKGGITEVTSDGVAADDWAVRYNDLKTDFDTLQGQYLAHFHNDSLGAPTTVPQPPNNTAGPLGAAAKSSKLKLGP